MTLHRDHLGSVTSIFDQPGGLDLRIAYRPFGWEEEFVVDPGAPTDSKGFIGERFDDKAKLHYLNARYYDPQLGTFIQPDWFETTMPGVGTNRYSYSFNDPVNLMDPGGNATNSDSAYASDDVYIGDDEDLVGASLPAHLTRLSAEERKSLYPGAVWEDEKTGFRAGAYKNKRTGEITIAFAGTKTFVDMTNNLQQALTNYSPQYSQARALAAVVSAATANRKGALSFTGHSLGGGLALEAANSLEAGIRSVNHHRDVKTFNPAGLRFSISEYAKNIWNGAIGRNRNFQNNVNVSDPVAGLNNLMVGVGVIGQTSFFAPVSMNPFENHSMKSFSGKFADGDF